MITTTLYHMYSFAASGVSLETVDEKARLEFFKEDLPEHEFSLAEPHVLGDHVIWTIEDFLSEEECDRIVDVCEQHGFESLGEMYDKSYRDSKRILAFDNGKLPEAMARRLSTDCFIGRLCAARWAKPYGFFTDEYTWQQSAEVNPCLRINKYKAGSTGFKMHRDAQYTKDRNVRSNYTIVVYLGNEGWTKFTTSNVKTGGLTVEEELQLNKNNTWMELRGRKGMAVIFDQRILHEGISSDDVKYVLRTDLLCTGTLNSADDFAYLNPDEIARDKLCRQLFRQAQYCDMIGDNANAKELYEICISMRQGFPCDIPALEKRLAPVPSIAGALVGDVVFLERSGKEYTFEYGGDEILCVKIAACFVLMSAVRNIDSTLIDNCSEFLQELFVRCGLNQHCIDFETTPEVNEFEILDNVHKDLLVDIGRRCIYNVLAGRNRNYSSFTEYYGHITSESEYRFEEEDYEDLENEFMEYIKKKINGEGAELSEDFGYSSEDFGYSSEETTPDIAQHIGPVLTADCTKFYGRPAGCSMCYDHDERDMGKMYHNDQWSLKMSDFEMIVDGDEGSGQINVKALGSTFNHAGCHCETIFSHKKTKSKEYPIDITMEYYFDCGDDEGNMILVIEYTPNITM